MAQSKKKLIVISLSFLLTCVANLFAQEAQMTPYEQKREQLATEAMEKLMNTMSAYDRTLFAVNLQNALKEAHEEGDKFQEMAIGENIIFKLCDISEGLQTEANLLASSLDISDVYSGRTLQEWNEIGRWYKQERTKLEKTKTAEDIRREKERVDANRDEPGIAGVKKRVAKAFRKWAKKGEFEKTVAWQERMNNRGIEVFDSLCFVCVNNQINANMSRKLLGDQYDADREGYNLLFSYEDEKGNIRSSVESFWLVTPDQLKRLGKTDWTLTYARGIFLKGIDIYPATYHWVAGDDEWNIILGDAQSVTIAMGEMVGDYCGGDSGHVFDYSGYCSSIVFGKQLAKMIYDAGVKSGITNNDVLLLYDFGWGNLWAQGKKYKDVVPDFEYDQIMKKKEVDIIMEKVDSYYSDLLAKSGYKIAKDNYPQYLELLSETDITRLNNIYNDTDAVMDIVMAAKNHKRELLIRTIRDNRNWSESEESRKMVEDAVEEGMKVFGEQTEDASKVIEAALMADQKVRNKYYNYKPFTGTDSPQEAWRKYMSSKDRSRRLWTK